MKALLENRDLHTGSTFERWVYFGNVERAEYVPAYKAAWDKTDMPSHLMVRHASGAREVFEGEQADVVWKALTAPDAPKESTP